MESVSSSSELQYWWRWYSSALAMESTSPLYAGTFVESFEHSTIAPFSENKEPRPIPTNSSGFSKINISFKKINFTDSLIKSEPRLLGRAFLAN